MAALPPLWEQETSMTRHASSIWFVLLACAPVGCAPEPPAAGGAADSLGFSQHALLGQYDSPNYRPPNSFGRQVAGPARGITTTPLSNWCDQWDVLLWGNFDGDITHRADLLCF